MGSEEGISSRSTVSAGRSGLVVVEWLILGACSEGSSGLEVEKVAEGSMVSFLLFLGAS
jgi:hypothetical protein